MYLGKNLITRMQGLDALVQLETLDLSDNRISAVEGLTHLRCLRTLVLANNQLATSEDIQQLGQCSILATLDLSG